MRKLTRSLSRLQALRGRVGVRCRGDEVVSWQSRTPLVLGSRVLPRRHLQHWTPLPRLRELRARAEPWGKRMINEPKETVNSRDARTGRYVSDKRKTNEWLLQRLHERHERLRSEYSDQRTSHETITQQLCPWRGRFYRKPRANRQIEESKTIYDSTAFRALRGMGAFLMGGGSSPARNWFRLTCPDPMLAELYSVREFYAESARRMRFVLSRSNAYQALHNVYEEVSAYGTACALLERDYNNVLHIHVLTAGQYYLATDSFGAVNTVYREFELTVGQLVAEFGLENVTPEIRTQHKNHQLETVHTVVHAVEPREDWSGNGQDQLSMPWRSVYFMKGERRDHRTRGILREGGYREFPFLVPRWSVTDRNSWGFGPGHEAVPHARRLQKLQFAMGKAVAYSAEPPLQGPASLSGKDVKLRPGGYTAVPGGGNQKIESMFEVRLDIAALGDQVERVQEQVQRALYNDLFLLIMNSRRAKTATEVDEMHEEKMLMLGPALERLHGELLRPLIERTFKYMDEAKLLPTLPSELQGVPLQVEFVSMLQQLQQASGVVTLERFLTMVGAGGEMFPDMLDVIDSDKVARDYADMLAIEPDNLRDPDDVAELRQARSEAQQAQAQVETAAMQAGAAKDLAAANKDAPQLSQQFSGYGNI